LRWDVGRAKLRPMTRFAAVSLSIALALAACGPSRGTTAPAADAVTVLPARFAEDSHASEDVRTQCDVENDLPRFVEKYSRGGAVFSASADPSQGRVVEITVVSVVAPKGGAWSGPKHMKIEARLLQDGQEVDRFEVDRSTTQGGYGTCDMLRRISAALGKDVARWLASRG